MRHEVIGRGERGDPYRRLDDELPVDIDQPAAAARQKIGEYFSPGLVEIERAVAFIAVLGSASNYRNLLIADVRRGRQLGQRNFGSIGRPVSPNRVG